MNIKQIFKDSIVVDGISVIIAIFICSLFIPYLFYLEIRKVFKR